MFFFWVNHILKVITDFIINLATITRGLFEQIELNWAENIGFND